MPARRSGSRPRISSCSGPPLPTLGADEQLALRHRLTPAEASGAIDDARRVVSAADGDVFVMSIGSLTCVLVRSSDGSGGTACASKDAVVDPARPPIVVDRLRGGRSRVTMLAADAIDRLIVEYGDGERRSAVVRNSIATMVVAGPPRLLSWDGPQGGSVRATG